VKVLCKIDPIALQGLEQVPSIVRVPGCSPVQAWEEVMESSTLKWLQPSTAARYTLTPTDLLQENNQFQLFRKGQSKLYSTLHFSITEDEHGGLVN
jgi:hypothetical protein